MAVGGAPHWERDLLEMDVLRPRHGDPYATTNDVVVVFDGDEPDGARIVWANRSFTEQIAPVVPIVDGRVRAGDAFREEDVDRAVEAFDEVVGGLRHERMMQLPTRTADGWRTFLWRIVDRRRDVHVGGVAVYGHDVSRASAPPDGEVAEFDLWWAEMYASSEPMIAVDLHNDLLAANAAAEQLFHPLDPRSAWLTIRHPDLLLLAFVDVNLVRPGRPMARVRPMLTRVQMSDGHPGTLIWLRDVTAETGRRRRIDRSAHRWSHVLESLPDPVFLVLQSGEVEFTNDAGADLVERVLGTRHGDDEVLHLDELFAAFDGPTGSTVRTLVAGTLDDGEARGPELVQVRHALHPMELLVRTVALAVGDEVLAVLAARDVTAERQATVVVAQLNEELRAAVAASELARVEERERIARAIHDDTLQRLTVLRWLLSDAVPTGLDPAAVTELDELIVALRDVMTSLASPVADLGLQGALRQAARQATTPVHLRCNATAAKAPRHVAELAYRSIREALRNIDAHAGASSAIVEVVGRARALHVTVRDDGRGVTPEAVAAATRAGHLGVVSIRESVLAERGSFELAAAPDGQGTILRLTIPYA